MNSWSGGSDCSYWHGHAYRFLWKNVMCFYICLWWTVGCRNIKCCIETDLRLLPLALQPTVGFGLSNNVLPFLSIRHQLSPSSHTQHWNISFCFLFPSFPVSSPSSRPSSSWVKIFLGILSSSILSKWPNQLIICLLSILLYFLLCSSLLVLDSSDFSISRFHI